MGRIEWSRRRSGTVVAGMLAVGIGCHIVLGSNGITAYRAKRKTARELRLQVQLLAREGDSLRDHVERLKTDPDAIEHQAREELHYARPGEVIYTLPSEPSVTR